MLAVIQALRYDREAIGTGQWWRLLTAHLVHLNFMHALLNACALIVLWLLFSRDYSPRQWCVIVLACVIAIDAGLWFLDPGVDWYVGASGVLHGVAAAGALSRLLARQREGWILGILLVGKLSYEQLSGALPLTQGIPVVVDAHLFGAIGGTIASAVVRMLAPARMKSAGADPDKTQ